MLPEEPTAWICEHCGSAANGELCMQCGHARPASASGHPLPEIYAEYRALPLTPGIARGCLIGVIVALLLPLFSLLFNFLTSR